MGHTNSNKNTQETQLAFNMCKFVIAIAPHEG
ncbi:hypothetical protein Rhal01_00274 [Rubritalea halochordaticola]|uniref:Uncharacterized protein n=1 Tax=Rubritalea halochordaticola TaxID=714537 RepID=A0ABP9UYK2_9BACT